MTIPSGGGISLVVNISLLDSIFISFLLVELSFERDGLNLTPAIVVTLLVICPGTSHLNIRNSKTAYNRQGKPKPRRRNKNNPDNTKQPNPTKGPEPDIRHN